MKYASVLITLLMLACSAAPSSSGQDAAPALPFIRVEGNRFVDEDGQTFVFRGVSFSDPDRLEKAGQWNKAYFQVAKDWNANVVRFPVHPQAWRERGEAAYLALLDQGVQWATELDLYVIIDWHSIGDLRTETFQNASYITTKAETLHFWQTIAERYKDNPTVAFYELFNEPTVLNGTYNAAVWSEHKAIMEELIAAIRAHDTTAIPLVAGFNWAYDLTPVRDNPIDAPGVAYVTHPYPQKREAPWENRWEVDWGFVADTYPIVATEFGFMSADRRGAHRPVIGDETYGEAIIGYFEEKGISWTAWVFDPQWSPQLLENWHFDPSPQGQFFQEKMMELN